jgi:hypothetical protein
LLAYGLVDSAARLNTRGKNWTLVACVPPARMADIQRLSNNLPVQYRNGKQIFMHTTFSSFLIFCVHVHVKLFKFTLKILHWFCPIFSGPEKQLVVLNPESITERCQCLSMNIIFDQFLPPFFINCLNLTFLSLDSKREVVLSFIWKQ